MLKPKSSWPDWLIKTRMPEFWKAWIIYLYPFLFVAWHTLRLKNKFWPVLLNPAIDKYGGFVGASKTHINKLFPSQYLPESLEYESKENEIKIIDEITQKIGFPCFIKPDNLMRGMGVQKLENPQQLENYLKTIEGKFFVQKELSQKEEYGVFISRMPGEKIKILSLTGKVFLTVTGDGIRNIQALLAPNFRYKLAKKFIDPVWESRFHEIPKKGDCILIQPVGNHNKGTYFVDLTDKITPEMVNLFDKIVPKEGVYYGRFDVKADDLKSLEKGENIGIIEFNGTVAEPVSYCDSKYNFFQGQRIIMQHFREQLRIATVLIKQGALAPTLQEGLKIVKQAKQFETEQVIAYND